MKNHNLPLKDKLTAQALSVGSKLVQPFSTVRDYIGGAETASYMPVRWRLDGMGASDIDWIRSEGNPLSGKKRKDYIEAAIIVVDPSEIETVTDKIEDFDVQRKSAVAKPIGGAVMVGVFPDSRGFGHYENETVVAMRIGQGELSASVGLWTPSTATYSPLESARLLARIPIDQVPATVPLV